MLTVTAQQSRFHNEAIEGSALKEIVVKDLSIAIGNREILSHAQFQLQVGKRYVLSGRNGVGKSTLLQAIATEQIPSIPHSLRVLLLGQTQNKLESNLEELRLTEQTVIEYVIRSDRKREHLLHEERILSVAIDNAKDPTAAVNAYRIVQHGRLVQETYEARRIQLRRSGARGANARKVLLQLEADLKESETKLQASLQELDAADMAQETQHAADTLATIQTTLELMGSSGAEAKARTVLLGLGFSQESIDQPMSRLSGGWKTRCSLACALCQSADLLLLDEPTNFLDLPSIIWLGSYLKSLEPTVTVLVVSHDRTFVDDFCEEILLLRNMQLERFRGNLSSYELERIKKWKYLSRMKEANDKKKNHMQSAIEQNIKSAKSSGDDKKLKQAASKKKKLDERMGMEVSAKGTRFKLNRDRAGWHNSNRDDIEVPDFDPPVRFVFPTLPGDLRFPGALVSFEKVKFAYAGKMKVPILRDVDLTIHMEDRIGIAGINGSGKTTLVSLAMDGMDDTPSSMKLTSGTITRHTRARFGLYSQQAAERLDALAVANPELTALSHLKEYAGGELSEKEARGLLSSLGLSGKTASDVPISLLSGGQKVRLALAKLLWMPPHLLILDEVTTHLDADSIEALIHALRKYEGAILVVTHDRFFMRCVVEGESPKSIAMSNRPGDDDEDAETEESDEETTRPGIVYRLSKGALKKLDGGMLRYEELAAKASAKMGKA